MRTIKWYILIITLFLNITVFAQSDKAPKKLKKHWRLYSYRMYDIKYTPSYRQRKDMLIIEKDNSYKQLHDGKLKIGTWSYDKSVQTLHLKSANNSDTTSLNIVKLKCKEFTFTSSQDDFVAVNRFITEKYFTRLKKKSQKKRERDKQKKEKAKTKVKQ